MTRLRLSELNRVDRERFVALVGDVVEHSPWVAEAAADDRPFRDVAAMHRAFARALASAGRRAQLAVICAHPDLGARLDELSTSSSAEQRSAGLATLDASERFRLKELNEAYRAKFGFPFVVAVKGADPDAIVAACEARLPNDLETEVQTALAEVERIVANRLADRIEKD